MYKDFILKTKYGREDLNSFTFNNPSSIKKLEHEASFDINQAGDSKWKKNHSFHTKIQGNAIPRSGEEEEKLAMDKNLTSW